MDLKRGVSRRMMANLYRNDDTGVLDPASRFRFHCHPGLACFNQCCRRPTIILRPFDILRLSRHLGLRTGEFLEQYTVNFRDDASLLPLLLLAPDASGCPFLHPESGCTVYVARPAACRLFPVTQGSRLTPKGVEDVHFLKALPFCRGFEAGREWTLAQWLADQGLAANETHDAVWKELLVRLGAPGQPPLDGRGQEFFSLALYDLDGLGERLAAGEGAETLGLSPEESQGLRSEADEERLAWGGRFLKRMFGLEK